LNFSDMRVQIVDKTNGKYNLFSLEKRVLALFKSISRSIGLIILISQNTLDCLIYIKFNKNNHEGVKNCLPKDYFRPNADVVSVANLRCQIHFQDIKGRLRPFFRKNVQIAEALTREVVEIYLFTS